MLNLRYLDDELPLERQAERLRRARREQLAAGRGRPHLGPSAWQVLRLWLVLLLPLVHRP